MTSGIEYMVEDGESENGSRKTPTVEEKRADIDRRRNPREEGNRTPQYQRYERRDGKRT